MAIRPIRTNQKIRNFVFTLANPTVTETADLQLLVTDEQKRLELSVRYIVFQEEVGVRGLRHFQGYIELTRQLSLRSIKRNFGNRLHVERRRGSAQQASDYCKKDDTRAANGYRGEGGVMSRQSKDKNQMIIDINDGMKLTDVADQYPEQFLRSAANIEKLIDIKAKPRTWPMEVHIFYGETGTGKSWVANEKAGEDKFDIFWPNKPSDKWWFDQYQGQEVCIADEFAGQVPMIKMMKFLDRWEWKVETKGGMTQFRSKRIYITTNFEPRTWYPHEHYRKPLWRRLDEFCKIYKFTKPASWEDENHLKLREEIEFHEVRYSERNEQYERYVAPAETQAPDSPIMDSDDEEDIDMEDNQQSADHFSMDFNIRN